MQNSNRPRIPCSNPVGKLIISRGVRGARFLRENFFRGACNTRIRFSVEAGEAENTTQRLMWTAGECSIKENDDETQDEREGWRNPDESQRDFWAACEDDG